MKKLVVVLFVIFIAAFITACGSQATPEPLDLTIELSEYKFTPDEIELKVGQQVTITLVNKGTLDHELMIGRNVIHNDEGRPDGYEVDFFTFAGVTPEVVSVGDSIQIMLDGEMLAGKMDMSGEGDMAMTEESMDMGGDEGGTAAGEEDHMDHMGYMVMVPPGEDTVTITFTVTPEMVGTWEIGCFELDGVHYDSGMVGTLTVVE